MEIRLSDVQNFMDLSSEFHKKEYKFYMQKIAKYPCKQLKDFCYITDGEHGSPDWDKATNIKYITAEHIKQNYIVDTVYKTISQNQYKKNKRAALSHKDLLIYSVGAYAGNAAVAEEHLFPASIPRSVAIIRILYEKEFTPQYLNIFMNSKFGAFQSFRYRAGNSQPMLALEKIEQFIIPILDYSLQIKITGLYDSSYGLRMKSKSLYTESEQLLLQELGLVNFKPSTEKIAIKKLSESFGTTGGLDAEYYQPKYEEIENVISKYRLGYNAIGSVFKLSKQNFKVDKDKLYEYVEIGSINVSSGEIVPELITGAELPSNAKRKLKVGQVIVSKVRTYRSGIAIIDKDNYVGSTAFSILEEKPNGKVNKETLFSFLRSNLFLEWSLKPNTGTSYPVILDEDILNFNIPLIDTNIQNIIASKIQQSFALRKESKHLLDIAKQAVEMAIEEDEETAIKWLNEVTIPGTNIHQKS